MERQLKACIFDLDGVLVDTAKFHFLAWGRLAEELGISGFDEEQNERLKGVSRMRSLEIILEIGGVELSDEKKLELTTRKNNWYREYLLTLTIEDVLPGVLPLLEELQEAGLKIGLGSASKNAGFIIEQVGIKDFFGARVDGTNTKMPKPNPEVFLSCAEALGVPPEYCMVFEDAQAGIEAAKAGGMKVIGIGSDEVLKGADRVVPNFLEVDLKFIEQFFPVLV